MSRIFLASIFFCTCARVFAAQAPRPVAAPEPEPAAVSTGPVAATECPGDMVRIGKFCMDRYEAPNKADAKPFSARTAPEGEAWCAAGGKRLCNEDEWIRACEGRPQLPFPYGAQYNPKACNDQKTWLAPDWGKLAKYPAPEGRAEVERLYQADPAGSNPLCVSDEGVYDLTGNVSEWVVRTRPNHNNFSHVMKGCYWSGCFGGSKPSCAFVNPAHPGTFRTYEAGFRCCLSLGDSR